MCQQLTNIRCKQRQLPEPTQRAIYPAKRIRWTLLFVQLTVTDDFDTKDYYNHGVVKVIRRSWSSNLRSTIYMKNINNIKYTQVIMYKK